MVGKKQDVIVKVFHGTKQQWVKQVKIEINMKIGFCGTMSVGKTTLVNSLKLTKEFAHYYFMTERSKYLSSTGIPLNTDSTLKGQFIFLAERCRELLYENVITDRTVIDVMAFSKAAKSIEYYDAEAFCDAASKLVSEYDYIFYVSPEGVEMEDNGIRETDLKYRETIDSIIKLVLYRNNHKIKNLVELSGTTEERIAKIKETIFG
jgi:GTPase SAR1 family protein